MRILILLFLVLALGAPCSYGQNANTSSSGTRLGSSKVSRKASSRASSGTRSENRRESRRVSLAATVSGQEIAFSQAAQEIKVVRPAITNATMNCDKQVIVAALPEIQRKFDERGFSEQEATEAALDSWKEVRFHSPLQATQCMVRVSFEEHTISLGHLVFRTTPNEAHIELNSTPLGKETDYSKWYPPKTYMVRYTKDGYVPVEKQCDVSEGKKTDCFVELQKIP